MVGFIDYLRSRNQIIITEDYVLSDTRKIFCDATSGNIDITLNVSPNQGDEYIITKIDSSANVVSIPSIDGETQTLTTQYDTITINYTDSNWYSI